MQIATDHGPELTELKHTPPHPSTAPEELKQCAPSSRTVSLQSPPFLNT